MKEKLLKEKGAVKMWVIVLVIVLCLVAAGGIFAYVKINQDKEEKDSKSTSQKKEDKEKDNENTTNTSKKDKKDEKDEKDDDDDEDEDEEDSKKETKKNSKERHFSGELDGSELGTEGMKWTMDIYGTDEELSKLTLTIDMEDAAKEMYEMLKDQYEKYDDFVKYLHDEMEKSLEGFEESFASSSGIDADDITGKVNWKKDEVLEMTLDFSKVDFSKLDMNLDESGSVIESVVNALGEEQNMKLKEVK